MSHTARTVASLMLGIAFPFATLASEPSLADRLGCTHVAGRYNFTDRDYLNEGAGRIHETGMKVIKVYLMSPDKNYPFNSRWPEFKTIVQVADHPYYKSLFAAPFKTYVLTVYARPNGSAGQWRDGFSDGEREETTRAFAALTKYLMRTYAGTGKTFVLQHWEGDWALRGNTRLEPGSEVSQRAIKGMIEWLNARQDGVNEGRAVVRGSDVKVYHACEVNRVDWAMEGFATVTNDVVPHTRCDLYSYSTYDTIGLAADDPAAGRALLLKALDYLASKAPDSKDFGDKNVYIGEFGWPEVDSETDPKASTDKAMNVIRMTTETALTWGCPYVIYWQLYDNESRAGGRRPDNSEVRGFYLIRPDGQRAPSWDYFRSLIASGRLPDAALTERSTGPNP